jgi:hypothetical protein
MSAVGWAGVIAGLGAFADARSADKKLVNLDERVTVLTQRMLAQDLLTAQLRADLDAAIAAGALSASAITALDARLLLLEGRHDQKIGPLGADTAAPHTTPVSVFNQYLAAPQDGDYLLFWTMDVTASGTSSATGRLYLDGVQLENYTTTALTAQRRHGAKLMTYAGAVNLPIVADVLSGGAADIARISDVNFVMIRLRG